MKKLNLALIAAAAVAAVCIIGAPSAASATETDPEVWQAWIMPNDGTDWPQAEATAAALTALPCGTTWRIQNDKYLTSERDRFVADGVLEYGEDFGEQGVQRGAIEWYFTEHTTPACEPEPHPEPTPTETPAPEPTETTPAPVPTVETVPDALPLVESENESLLILAETGPEDDALGLILFGFGVIIIGAGAFCFDRIKNGARR